MTQPRVPAGSSAGGEFASAGGAGAGAGGGTGEGGRKFETKDDADNWGREQQQAWTKTLTHDEEASLNVYTVMVGINDTLRSKKEPGTAVMFNHHRNDGTVIPMTEAKALAGLDAVFAKPGAVLQEDVVTHRAWAGKICSVRKDGTWCNIS